MGEVVKIPPGKVTTYGRLARRLKTSPRAVGQALKRNRRPIVIPCHRVVASDGAIGGYRLGIERKISLLRCEGVQVRNKRVDIRRFGI